MKGLSGRLDDKKAVTGLEALSNLVRDCGEPIPGIKDLHSGADFVELSHVGLDSHIRRRDGGILKL